MLRGRYRGSQVVFKGIRGDFREFKVISRTGEREFHEVGRGNQKLSEWFTGVSMGFVMFSTYIFLKLQENP